MACRRCGVGSAQSKLSPTMVHTPQGSTPALMICLTSANHVFETRVSYSLGWEQYHLAPRVAGKGKSDTGVGHSSLVAIMTVQVHNAESFPLLCKCNPNDKAAVSFYHLLILKLLPLNLLVPSIKHFFILEKLTHDAQKVTLET